MNANDNILRSPEGNSKITCIKMWPRSGIFQSIHVWVESAGILAVSVVSRFLSVLTLCFGSFVYANNCLRADFARVITLMVPKKVSSIEENENGQDGEWDERH